MSRFSSIVTVLAMAFLGTGCETTATLPPLTTSQQQLALVKASEGPKRLQPGDKIKLTVFGEDRLSGEFPVSPAGTVSLPLAGTVKAAGLTNSQLEKTLARKFRGDYLRDPKVTVEIAAYRPIYMLGEVEKPGEYPYKPGVGVMAAIALAGGTTYRAKQSQVLIKRAGETGFREYSLKGEVPVLPGDLIKIPKRYF